MFKKGNVAAITTTVQGIGFMISLMLAIRTQEKVEQQEGVVAAHVQDATTVHEDV